MSSTNNGPAVTQTTNQSPVVAAAAYFNADTAANMLASNITTLGSTWYATDLAAEFILKANPSGGVYWAPRGGRQVIYTRAGSLTAPIATLNAITAGTFALPGGNPTFPAGLLIAGMSRVVMRAHFKRAGATAGLTLNFRFGSNGTTSDNAVYSPAAAALNPELRVDTYAAIGGATTYTTTQGLAFNINAAATSADRTTNFNTALPNIVTVDISGANASDGPFGLISFEVELLG